MPEPKKGIQLANNVTELTAIAPLIPGGADRLRKIFALKRSEEAEGKPSPIEQIETIHYARWVILDGGTRLLFTSNFDGDLDGYLKEFAERDEAPLNLIFGLCDGWPGARPADSFIQYVRKHMVPAEYYYSAYPRTTVKEVKRALYREEKTDAFSNDVLPKLADLAVVLKECCCNDEPARTCLASQGFDLNTLQNIKEKVQEFLGKLAMPTPEDFGRARKNQEEVPS